MTETATFQTVAQELANAFERGVREDGSAFYKFADSAPEWCDGNLAHRIHAAVDGANPRFPSDWIYASMVALADDIAHCVEADAAYDAVHEMADGAVDIYSPDLFEWMKNVYNAALVEEAQQEFGIEGMNITQQIQRGQYLGLTRIASALIDEIQEELDNRTE